MPWKTRERERSSPSLLVSPFILLSRDFLFRPFPSRFCFNLPPPVPLPPKNPADGRSSCKSFNPFRARAFRRLFSRNPIDRSRFVPCKCRIALTLSLKNKKVGQMRIQFVSHVHACRAKERERDFSGGRRRHKISVVKPMIPGVMNSTDNSLLLPRRRTITLSSPSP